MRSPVTAAIDLGTNTARLLIGRVTAAGELEQVLLQRVIVRLGGGFTRKAGLATDACRRALDVLAGFASEMARHDVSRYRAVATSAVRDAVNGAEFCAQVLNDCGIELEVIDGDQEGRLTLDGILSGLDTPMERVMAFDIGGGSTEYTLACGDRIAFTTSLPLGVVRLTEGKPTTAAMSDKIDRELDRLRNLLVQQGMLTEAVGAHLVGTAGTVTTLAAISLGMTDYDYRLVNNYLLDIEEIKRIYELLLPLTPAERLQVPGLEQGREDLVVAGILVVLRTMHLFGAVRLKVSDFGLLEGVLRSVSASGSPG